MLSKTTRGMVASSQHLGGTTFDLRRLGCC